tara:strand:- start:114 stop:269 length:156 start_codon:yes stop_codon:yes gene_type:complete
MSEATEYPQNPAPCYTTTGRVGISSVTGSIIFNTTTTKLQVYTGSTWVDLH